MIPIQGIDHVALNVRDLDKSMVFYTQILGLSISAREPSKPGIEYFLDCGPSLLGLIQASDLNSAHPFANEGIGANHFSLHVRAQDFNAMIGHLEEHHVPIAFAKKRPRSWSLYFYDIDANKLEITAWPLEDGIPENERINAIYDSTTKLWQLY